MKKTKILVAIASLLLASVAMADDGNDWNAASAASRLKEMQRILGNIKRNGCTVKLSPEYYVRQLNDFYATPASRKIEVSKAVGLIATGAGEDWKC